MTTAPLPSTQQQPVTDYHTKRQRAAWARFAAAVALVAGLLTLFLGPCGGVAVLGGATIKEAKELDAALEARVNARQDAALAPFTAALSRIEAKIDRMDQRIDAAVVSRRGKP